MLPKWVQIPLLRPLFSFVLGLIAGKLLQLDLRVLVLLLFLLFFVLVVFMLVGKKWKHLHFIRHPLLLLIVLHCGWICSVMSQKQVQQSNNKADACLLVVQSNPIFKARTVKFAAKISTIRVNSDWQPNRQQVMVYLARDANSSVLHYGDELLISTNVQQIQVPRNPGEFDYRTWLANHQITGQVYAKAYEWKFISSGKGNGLKAIAIRLRNWYEFQLRYAGFHDDQLTVLQALLLGDDDQIDPGLTKAYSSSGTLHVLSVSGMHVALLYIVLTWLLKPLRRFKHGKWIITSALLIILWFYALLTGASPPILRAVIMLSLVVIGQAFYKQGHILNMLAAAAIALLALDPLLLVDVGFQLSFIAVAGIVVLQPALQHYWKPKWLVLKWIWSLTSVTLVAQLVTFPLGLYYFGQFPVYFLISNLVVIPLSTIIMYGGLLLLVLSPISFLASWLAIPLSFILDIMNSAVRLTDVLPGAVITTSSWTILQLVLWYAFVLSLGYAIITYRVKPIQLSLFFVLILLLSCWPERYNRQRRHELLVYSISGATAFEVIKGNKHILFMDSSGIKNSKFRSYHIQPGWRKDGLGDIKPLALSDDLRLRNSLVAVSANWLQAGQTLIYSIGPNSTSPIHRMPCTVLLVNGYTIDSPDHFLKQLQPKYVVINGSCSQREVIRWKTICAKQHLECINVNETGFWILNLNHFNM